MKRREFLRTSAAAGAGWWSGCSGGREPVGERLALAGEWAFHLGPWEASGAGFRTDRIRLPGSTDEAGYGTKTEGADLGYLTRAYKYTGPCCYRREIEIPAAWAGRLATLFLERCHWRTRVWVDGEAAGSRNSLSTPHEYELGKLEPGRHRLTIEVDNSPIVNIGRYGHSYTEHTQSIWNGIVGQIELRAMGPAWIERLRIDPDVAGRRVRVSGRPRAIDGAPAARLVLTIREMDSGAVVAETEQAVEDSFSVALSLGGNARLWDEFSPSLYALEARLTGDGGKVLDQRIERFGLRELATRDGRVTLNGRPLMLRGTLECCIFPRTGYPPTDVEAWRGLIEKARAHGLNHLRFHSWCPPKAAFQAADEAGFLLHVETHLWIDKWMGERTILKTEKLPPVLPQRFGDEPAVVEFIQAELRRILDAYGNHPSFAILCIGNEIYGDYDLLDRMIGEAKQRDPRRLYCCSTARRHMPRDDIYVTHATKSGRVRGILGQGTADDYRKSAQAVAVPVISHEIGQWVTHLGYGEIPKYTGPLKPRNLALFRDRLAKRGLLDVAGDFQRASGRFAWKLYKEEIEAAMRTPLAGFQLLQLQDFPGQGEALVGLLDSFWDSKGILEPREFRRFCSPTVPLLRMERFVWRGGETFTAEAEIGHYGAAPIPDAVAEWSIRDDAGKAAATGSFPARKIPTGALSELGPIEWRIPESAAAGQWKARVAVRGTEAVNEWDVWIYPRQLEPETGEVLVTRTLDASTRAALAAGRAVLLLPHVSDSNQYALPTRFLPVFWSFAMFGGQPGCLGVLCDPRHPALARFPTEFHCDWQWHDLMETGHSFVLDDAPAGYRPLVEVIDDFHRAHKLGAIFETRVGPGKLMVCGFDLETNLPERPVARQLRHSLLAYMNSELFRPGTEFDQSHLDRMLA